MEERYIAYTDGACSNNQGKGGQPGGWGVVFLDGREFSGGEALTTNNRMELKAAIEAIKNIPQGSTIEIHSDSAYLINAFEQGWLKNWMRKNWITSKGTPVENQDLWKELLKLTDTRSVHWVKVKGHSGDKWNEVADKLAVEAIPQKGVSTQQMENKNMTFSLTIEEYNKLMNLLKTYADNDEAFKQIYNKLQNSLSTVR